MTDLSPTEGKEPPMSDHEKLQIKILLQEYQSCHDTRNHYDNVRWMIGSIFIVTSLALFGLSLDKPLVAVLLAFLSSVSSMMIWYLYAQHVNHYIVASIIRCHEIEKYLRKDLKFEIKLHTSIRKMDNSIPKLKGTVITFSLISMVIVIWFFRILWSIYILSKGITHEFVFWFILLGFIFGASLFKLWVLHNKLNPTNLSKNLEDIDKDC
jgi:hypothetical protein